jgi:hypothetical protein
MQNLQPRLVAILACVVTTGLTLAVRASAANQIVCQVNAWPVNMSSCGGIGSGASAVGTSNGATAHAIQVRLATGVQATAVVLDGNGNPVATQTASTAGGTAPAAFPFSTTAAARPRRLRLVAPEGNRQRCRVIVDKFASTALGCDVTTNASGSPVASGSVTSNAALTEHRMSVFAPAGHFANVVALGGNPGGCPVAQIPSGGGCTTNPSTFTNLPGQQPTGLQFAHFISR